jgi:dTMP kinase
MLYAGDRKDAAETISSWLNDGKVVILDRYTYSNIAYQCAKLMKSVDQDKLMHWILSLEFNHFAIPKPDLNIFLDVPFTFTKKKLSETRTGDDRSYLNGTRDIHEESIVFQGRVRDIYLKVSETDDRLAVINCSNDEDKMLTPPEIFALILKVLKDRKFV